MIQLKSEDFVFDEPKQSSQRRWFPARGASNEVPRLSDVFELPFLGHRSLQRRTINSIYLALSSLCLPFQLLAEGAYERAGDPSEGLRGSLRFNPIVFQRQPPGGKQRKHPSADTKPDCLQTQRLSKNNRVLRSLAGARDEHPLIRSKAWPRRASFSSSRSWVSVKLVGQTNKMPCNYFRLFDTNSRLHSRNLRDSLAASEFNSQRFPARTHWHRTQHSGDEETRQLTVTCQPQDQKDLRDHLGTLQGCWPLGHQGEEVRLGKFTHTPTYDSSGWLLLSVPRCALLIKRGSLSISFF